MPIVRIELFKGPHARAEGQGGQGSHRRAGAHHRVEARRHPDRLRRHRESRLGRQRQALRRELSDARGSTVPAGHPHSLTLPRAQRGGGLGGAWADPRVQSPVSHKKNSPRRRGGHGERTMRASRAIHLLRVLRVSVVNSSACRRVAVLTEMPAPPPYPPHASHGGGIRSVHAARSRRRRLERLDSSRRRRTEQIGRRLEDPAALADPAGESRPLSKNSSTSIVRLRPSAEASAEALRRPNSPSGASAASASAIAASCAIAARGKNPVGRDARRQADPHRAIEQLLERRQLEPGGLGDLAHRRRAGR